MRNRAAALLASAMGLFVLAAAGGCASVDPSQFAQLNEAIDTLQTRTVETHARVRKLQDVVYRNKVSLAPKLDAESLARPAWLDTNDQFVRREAELKALQGFAGELRTLAGLPATQTTQLKMRSLYEGSDAVIQTTRDVAVVASAAGVLAPLQPMISGLVGGLFPGVGLVGVAMAGPVLDRVRRSDLRQIMRTGQPVFTARVEGLARTTEVLAEYVLALKTEYLPDASALRDQLSGGDRYRFDQTVIDLLAEFDVVAARAAALGATMKILDRAYVDLAAGRPAPSGGGDALRALARDTGAK